MPLVGKLLVLLQFCEPTIQFHRVDASFHSVTQLQIALDPEMTKEKMFFQKANLHPSLQEKQEKNFLNI